jgi:hypothetical protein
MIVLILMIINHNNLKVTFKLYTTLFVFNDTPLRLQVGCNLYFVFCVIVRSSKILHF